MTNFDTQQIAALKKSIAADAPTLAAILDGPEAAVAVSLLGKTLVGDAEAPLSDIVSTAAGNNSDSKLKIAAAEQQGQMRLRQSQGNSDVSLANLDPLVAQTFLQEATKQQKVILDDVADARRRQVQSHDRTNQYLAYLVTAFFFLLIVLVLFFGNNYIDDKKGAKELIYTLLGVVATNWANIIGYYFGSSAGSSQKSQVLSDALMQKSGK